MSCFFAVIVRHTARLKFSLQGIKRKSSEWNIFYSVRVPRQHTFFQQNRSTFRNIPLLSLYMTSPLLMRQHCDTSFHSKILSGETRSRPENFSFEALCWCGVIFFMYFLPFSHFPLLLCFYSGENSPAYVENFRSWIFTRMAFLVFNYNLFNHETTAKLYAEKCWIFIAWLRPYMFGWINLFSSTQWRQRKESEWERKGHANMSD